MKKFTFFLYALSIILFLDGCKKPHRYDLIVENAIIVDADGIRSEPQTILINADTIAGIIGAGEPVRTRRVVDADGRIVMPGFIDSHTYLANTFVSKGKAFDSHPRNLTTFYRSMMSKHFLPYGITTIVDVESDSSWVKQILKWKPNPKFTEVIPAYLLRYKPNYFNNSVTFPSKFLFVEGHNPSDDVLVEFEKQDGVRIFTISLQNNSDIYRCSRIEGVPAIILSLLKNDPKAYPEVLRQISNVYGITDSIPDELIALEGVKYLSENNPAEIETVTNRLGAIEASVSTGLFKVKHFVDSGFTLYGIASAPHIKQRLLYGYTQMLTFVHSLHLKGVKLRLGSNGFSEGVSTPREMQVLSEAGLSLSDIAKISSYNSALAFGIEAKKGRIAPGFDADLVVINQSGTKTSVDFSSIFRVIKSGKVVKPLKN